MSYFHNCFTSFLLLLQEIAILFEATLKTSETNFYCLLVTDAHADSTPAIVQRLSS
jgi:hypothetical protein